MISNKSSSLQKFSFNGNIVGIGIILTISFFYFLVENPFHFGLPVQSCFLFCILSLFLIGIHVFDGTYHHRHLFQVWGELLRIVAYTLTATLVFCKEAPFYDIIFWTCLVVWSAYYIHFSYLEQFKRRTRYEISIRLVNSIWMISIAYIIFGDLILNYAKGPIHRARNVHWLLDVRESLGLSILILFGYHCLTATFKRVRTFLRRVEIKMIKVPGRFVVIREFREIKTVHLNQWFTFLVGTKMGLKFFAVEIIEGLKTLYRYAINLFLFIGIIVSQITAFYVLLKLTDPLLKYLSSIGRSQNSFIDLGICAWFVFVSVALLFIVNILFTMLHDGKNLTLEMPLVYKKTRRQTNIILAVLALTIASSSLSTLLANLLHWSTFTWLGILPIATIFALVIAIFFILDWVTLWRFIKRIFVRIRS